MKRIPWVELVDFGSRLLRAKGVPEESARCVAEIAVKTEAFGIPTHGLAVWVRLLGKLDAGDIDPAAQPEIVADRGASAAIEGHSGIGPLALHRAVELALERAPQYGSVTITGRNVSWLGALGVYLMPLAERGFLAQVWAQTDNCRDCAPWGGIDPRFSTNPTALAFPTGGDPVIADFSTAVMSWAKAMQLQRAGQRAPEPVFLDKQGNLTDDANVMDENGTMLFLGGEHYGYKGYALSLWCEALSALAGGRCNNPSVPQRQSFCLTALAPEAFGGSAHYMEEIRRFIAHVKSSRVREGFDAIRLPGERGYRALREAREKGVPVDDARLAQLRALAEKEGVEWDMSGSA